MAWDSRDVARHVAAQSLQDHPLHVDALIRVSVAYAVNPAGHPMAQAPWGPRPGVPLR